MPLMTCAPKRETSCVAPTDCAAAAHCVDSIRSIYWLSIMVIDEPMATSIYVLNPAGELRRSRLEHFLKRAGCDIISSRRSVRLISDGKLNAVGRVSTGPYPEFPTDMQPLLMAALLKAVGRTDFIENVFDSRFGHAKQLSRFGADISVEGRQASVWGVRDLRGAVVSAGDLRGGAAMIIAALSAEGESLIVDPGHIARGYEHLDHKLRSLGADIFLEL